MQVLITGAAGFIGSAITSSMCEHGSRVMAVDNLSSYYSVKLKNLRKSILTERKDVIFHNCDLSNLDSVYQLFSKFNFSKVIHLAAQPGVRLQMQNWANYTKDNLTGFSNLLTVSAEKGVKDFLYASSSSIYGNSQQKYFKESDSTNKPVSFYGATKLANEILASSISRATGIKTRGLRFFTVYGPWGRPDMVYFRMVASAITGEPFEFFGDGQVQRDFTYISDVVKMTIDLSFELESRKPGFYDVVNIGGGQPKSINQILEIIQEISGVKIPFSRLDANSHDVLRTSADFSYLKSLIDVYPEVDTWTGMQEVYSWARRDEISEHLSDWVRSVP